MGRVNAPDARFSARRSARLSHSGQEAWIVADEVDEGWVLQIGGIDQSHVDLSDPTRVVHEYLRRIANVLDAFRPVGEPVRVLHLGAGALTLPRYVQATRPGSPQTVVEIERELPTLVTGALPLPVGTQLDVVIGDARESLAEMAQARFDAIVLDVFSGEESPAHLATRDFYTEALPHLERDGLLVVNVGDDAGLRFAAGQARELEHAAAEHGLSGVWLLADSGLVTHLREGNLVLVAGGAMSSSKAEDWRSAWNAAGPHPAAVLDPMETADFVERVLGEA